MKDLVPKGTGNSRFLRSSIPENITHEELVALLRAGTFPVDFAGLNTEGIATQGSAYNKANVLPDSVCTALGIPTSSEPRDAFSILNNSGWKEYERITASKKFVVPEDVYRIAVMVISGGSSGEATKPKFGNSDNETLYGGKAGGIAFAILDVTPGQTIPCVVGAAGKGSTVSNTGGYAKSNPGGVSSFGSISADLKTENENYIIQPIIKYSPLQPQIKAGCSVPNMVVEGAKDVISTDLVSGDFGNSGISKAIERNGPLAGTNATGYGNGGGSAMVYNAGFGDTYGDATSGSGSPGIIIVYI